MLSATLKDVDGVYEGDPANSIGGTPARYESMAYSDAIRVAGPLIQPKAVQFLAWRGTCAEVAALARPYSSVVGAGPTALAAPLKAPPRALKVLLLGLGTVGYGVYQGLVTNPQAFEIVGAIVRNRAKYSELNVRTFETPSDAKQVGSMSEVVVDLLPGIEPSKTLVEAALRAGIHVVSANKTLIAEYGDSLKRLCETSGATLRYAASVGGSTPMLELVDRLARRSQIVSFSGVLNGTCAFVLEACAGGMTLGAAIAEAQRAGFAESDATEDLSGRDAERKLRILCRHAFGVAPDDLAVQALDESVARRACELAATGHKLAQVARASRELDAVRARIAFEEMAPEHLLKGEWNVLTVCERSGQKHTVSGRGAGRWPTAEAVLSDLFEVYRSNLRKKMRP